MKVCGRTSRRRRSAARCRTRNPLNPRVRLPAQNGPAPADGSAAALPDGLFSATRANRAPARTGRGAPSLYLPARTNRLLAPPAVAPHRAPAMLFSPFSPDFEPLEPPPAGLSLTMITPGPQERP